MNITEKIVAKQNGNFDNPGITVAFLGDSVTQGCFEVYLKSDGGIETVFDRNSAYHMYFSKIFSVLCPNVPVNVINAGISGGTAPHGLERLDRDVLKFSPDLVVVCFGLNDCGGGLEKLDCYKNSLAEIFDRVKESGSELIFMTPNMMCTDLSCHIKEEKIREIAGNICNNQKNGILDAYIECAKEVCKEKNVTVCDCYKKWKRLSDLGINVTELLANKINHPTREMNWLFAYSLVETILGL